MTEILLAARLRQGIANGRRNVLLVGRVTAPTRIAEITLYDGGAAASRLVFGAGHAPPEYGFAFTLMRPGADTDDAWIEIAASGPDGVAHRQGFTIRADAADPETAHAVEGTAEDATVRAPLLLYAERAIATADRITGTGWVVGRSPLVELAVLAGGARAGLARTGLLRPDVAHHHAAYPDAERSGFSFSLPGCFLPGTPVTLQAVMRDGSVHAVTLPLAPPEPEDDPASAPEPVPVAAPPPAVPETPLRLECDAASVLRDGTIAVSGWCAGPVPIRHIAVSFAGHALGFAEHGAPRPDVAEAFPALHGAAQAGFRFAGIVPAPVPEEGTLRIEAEDAEDRTRRRTLVLLAAEPEAVAAAPEPAADPDGTSRLFIDTPSVIGGALPAAIADSLSVAGWALARDGVETITAEIDDGMPIPVRQGQRREDIEAAFPDWPDARSSGFALHVSARMLASLRGARHRLTIRLRTKGGTVRETGFSFAVDRTIGAGDERLFRRTLPFAEARLLRRVLDRHRAMTRFAIAIEADDPAEDALFRTRRSVERQAYGDWRILPPEAMPEPDDYVLHLRPGDELAADALAEFALALAMQPGTDLLYADDIRANAGRDGRREPFHKPGWSPDLLLASDYIGRAWCARGALMAGVAGRGHARILSLTRAARTIRHVPKLLFAHGAQPEADRRAVQALLGPGARAGAGLLPRTARIRRPHGEARVSVIIPTSGASGHILRCLPSLRRTTRRGQIEIIVLDNIRDRTDPAAGFVRDAADRVIRIDAAFNWSRFNNIAAAEASGSHLLFLNDDTEATKAGWLDAMLDAACAEGAGPVGPQLLYPDGTVQHAGMFLMEPGRARHAFRFQKADEPGYFGLALTTRTVIAVTGACLLVRRALFADLGGFDEAHAIVNNDLDFCLRAHARGYRSVYTPHASLIHHELASRAALADDYAEPRFMAAWGDLFAAGDPYFNPNLSRGFDDVRPEREPAETIVAGPVFDPAALRRILAVKLDHIGDFVTALPALRRLKHLYPAAELHVLASAGARAIAASEPCIDRVHGFEFFHARSGDGRREVTDDDLRALSERLAPLGFDLAIDLRKHDETRVVLPHTGAAVLAGFDADGRFPWLDIAIPWAPDRTLQRKHRHVTDDLLSAIEAVALAGQDAATVPPLAAADAALPDDAEALFRRAVIVLHPGVGQETRQWPQAHFAALADMLLAAYDVSVLLIGSPDEAALAEGVLALLASADRAASLAGRLPLAHLPALLRRAVLYVGNNSGPKHIAAALGLPTVGIHSGVVDAREWGPRGSDALAIQRRMECSPCYIAALSQCVRDFACMRELMPATVMAACERMLPAGMRRGSPNADCRDHPPQLSGSPWTISR